MPIDTSGLTRAFKKLGDQFEQRDPVYRAVIVSDDGEGFWTVDFSNPDLSTGTRRQVRGEGNYWIGLPVRISRDRKLWGPNEWVIMGADPTSYPAGYDTDNPPTTVALHGWTHGFYQPDETTNLSTFQIYSLRVQPADPADQTVDILAGIYYADGAFHYLDATANENLAAFIAALGLGERQYLVLSIDSAGAINVTQGTPVVGLLAASDIPEPPDDERALCAVDIRNNDTALTRDRMYADLRFLPGSLNGEFALSDLGDYVRGYVMRGGAADWEAYDASTDGAVLIGDGTDIVSDTTPTFSGLTTHSAGITSNGLLTTTAGRVVNTTRIAVGDSPYAVLVTDHVIFCDTDGGAITANLPAGVDGTHYKLINCGSSGNDLTVDPNGAEQLYGAGAGVASTLADGEVIDIHYNGTEGWW